MIRQFFILLFLVLSASGPGQTPEKNDNIFQEPDYRKDHLYRLYFESVSAPNEIINGKEYITYYFHSKTTPLLFSGEILNATMKIKNREYRNIGLQYDTYLDELIYTDTSRFIDNIYPRIALNKDIVEGFGFVFRSDSMHFRYLKFETSPENDMEDGFYEIAYNGDTRFIIKHKSDIYNHQALNEYDYSPEGYILVGGTFSKIKNSKGLLPIFGERSEEIKEFLKESKIRIKKAGKNDIIKVLVFFDSLKDPEAGTQ